MQGPASPHAPSAACASTAGLCPCLSPSATSPPVAAGGCWGCHRPWSSWLSAPQGLTAGLTRPQLSPPPAPARRSWAQLLQARSARRRAVPLGGILTAVRCFLPSSSASFLPPLGIPVPGVKFEMVSDKAPRLSRFVFRRQPLPACCFFLSPPPVVRPPFPALLCRPAHSLTHVSLFLHAFVR